MLLRPIQTEKAFTQSTKNTYMFIVPLGASKQAVSQAVETEYKVSVIKVRVLNRKGKKTRFSRGKHAYPGTTFRQAKRFAYVTLKDGDKIKVFDEEATKETKAEDNKTTIKAADEKQSTSTKKASLFTKRRTGNRGDK